MPAIKNKIFFDYYSSSSWSGLNAAQSFGYDAKEYPKCSFGLFELEKYNKIYKKNLSSKIANNKIVNRRDYNDLGIILKSKHCSKASNKYFFNEIDTILFKKLKRFISVHAHLSTDFWWKPHNWNERFIILNTLNYNTYFKAIVFVFFMLIYSFSFYFFIKSIFKKKRVTEDKFIISIVLMYAYLIGMIFIGSSFEQERMRFTEYSFIFIMISIFIKKFAK